MKLISAIHVNRSATQERATHRKARGKNQRVRWRVPSGPSSEGPDQFPNNMKHHATFNLWAHAPPHVIPEIATQRAQFECCHCHRTTYIPVPVEYCDWEKVANEYRKYLQETFDRMGQAMQEIELIHGMENPVTQFYRNKWAMLSLEIQTKFGTAPRGTSANQRDNGEDHGEGWKHR